MSNEVLIHTAPGEGRIHRSKPKSTGQPDGFRFTAEKATCTVLGLSGDAIAVAAWPAFYAKVRELGQQGADIKSASVRAALQHVILRHAGHGSPGTIRDHNKPDPVVVAHNAVAKVAITRADILQGAVEILLANDRLDAKTKGAAVHLLYSITDDSTDPAALAGYAYVQSFDNLTKS